MTARGPLSEADTLAAVGEIDGYICGDDAITRAVLEQGPAAAQGDLASMASASTRSTSPPAPSSASRCSFTPGVNHTTVAEHAFLLLLALEKNLLFHCDSTRAGGWKRQTGHEMLGKTIGIVGLGRIGREVAIRGQRLRHAAAGLRRLLG